MLSDALKIARLNARVAREQNITVLAKSVLCNPVVELLVGVSILEYQSRHGNIGNGVNIASLAALYGIIGVQVLAPVLPVVTEFTAPLISGAVKALPMVASL